MTLFALSDLHVRYAENRAIVEATQPPDPGDWLLVAGDVGERLNDLEWALATLRSRFARVVWAPGNHELWSPRGELDASRGEARYREVVELCRSLEVLTPEDPYALWPGPEGPVAVAPLFLLYDYSFRADGTTREEALAAAYAARVVCNDEFLLHPDPWPSRQAWCAERVAVTSRRLVELGGTPVVLVNHFPLVRAPTRALRHPQFAQWCGTTLTADWHLRFRAAAVVYGHLHIPRTTWHDDVRFEEVSLGYPREWRRRPAPPGRLRQILPAP
jgi:3',5'-cyclic AMP phosphodiesterase CpdA